MKTVLGGAFEVVKRIFGSYSSEERALETVADLQTKGYAAEDLMLISNQNNQIRLEEQTEVAVKSSSNSSGSNSFIDKIKKAFTQNDELEDKTETKDKLVEFGLSSEQAESYAQAISNGDILIAADEETAGSTIKPLTDPNLDPVDNTETPGAVSHHSQSDGDLPRVTAEDPEPSLESIHPSKENQVYSPSDASKNRK